MSTNPSTETGGAVPAQHRPGEQATDDTVLPDSVDGRDGAGNGPADGSTPGSEPDRATGDTQLPDGTTPGDSDGRDPDPAVVVLPDGVLPDGVPPDGVPPDGVPPDGVLPDAVPPEGSPALADDSVLPDIDAGSHRSGVGGVDRERTRALFGRLRDLDADDPARASVRDSLVEQHLPLVEHLARRFRNRGEMYDDLVQVATIGLIKSVDRFDLERGVEFSTYATPTIVGEIKRHFRDKGWAVRVPRRLQELRLSLTAATAELSQRNGRSPTVNELAKQLGISDEEVLEGLESANAYSTLSLDAGGEGGDDEGVAVVDTLGVEDEGLEGVEYRESLKPLLDRLPPREKKILMLRFFRNMTQSEIAREVGISQMHVSRLLARTLSQLREGLLTEE